MLAFILALSPNLMYAQLWQGNGRIAVSSDGNQHDSDDWAATAVTLAIIGNRQLQDKLVHYDYANHVWNNNTLFETNIEESALGAAQRFGFDQSKFFNAYRNQTAAINSIKNAVNASSANNRLYFILAGPMEVPYQGILAADANKRQYVTCISHSTWNDHHGDCDDGRDWTECHPGSHHKPDIEALGVTWVGISDQNTNKFNTGSMASWNFLNTLNGTYDAAYEWTYTRVDLAYTTGDASDCGIAYYLFTGDQNGNTTKLENFMKTPVSNPNPSNATVNCTTLPSSLTSGTSITASVDYTADQSRDVVIELWNSGWLGQGKTTVNAGSGTANIIINLSNAPAAGSNYLLKASIRPVGASWQQNIDACNKNNITVTTGGSANQAPYGGTARTLPGSVEAEHFDTGGQGVAYNDTGANNIGGSFRTSEGVDITSLAAGGHTVGWTANGEWLEYTVNFNVSQDYDFFPSVSSPSSSGRLRILIDGVAQTGDLTVPNTGSYNTYQVMHVRNINVSAGTHVVRMEIVNSGFNLNSWAAWKAQFPAARTIGDLEEQMSDPTDMRNFSVYPNPFSSGNLTIVPRSNQPGVIQIFSLQGKRIFERSTQGNSIEITRDVFNASGIYIIKVNDLRQKLIVH